MPPFSCNFAIKALLKLQCLLLLVPIYLRTKDKQAFCRFVRLVLLVVGLLKQFVAIAVVIFLFTNVSYDCRSDLAIYTPGIVDPRALMNGFTATTMEMLL